MPTIPESRARAAVSRHLSIPEQYAELAHRRAASGEVRRAQLASWASDVHALEELLWENGLAEAADPVEQLAALGESIATAVEALAQTPVGGLTPRDLVEAAREALVATFDESVHAALRDELSPLGHLEWCEPGHDPATDGVAQRLGGRTPERLVEELRDAACDCAAVADAMTRHGEESTGGRLAHQGDMAAFEAYLVSAAMHAGDHSLASVDLRWELAGDLDRHALDTAHDAFATLRRKLVSLVGSAEMEALWYAIESPEAPR